MKNQLIPFDFETHECPVLMDEQGNPWWIAKSVCDILGIVRANDAMPQLDEDEKQLRKIFVLSSGEYLIRETPVIGQENSENGAKSEKNEKNDDSEDKAPKESMAGQNRNMWTINESGLWSLILRSNKPEAKRLKKWVTSEVLPTIRRTGSYSLSAPDEPYCRYPFFNRLSFATDLAALRETANDGLISKDELRLIIFDGEAEDKKPGSIPGEAPRKWKLNPGEEAVDRFVEEFLEFTPGKFESARRIWLLFDEYTNKELLGKKDFVKTLTTCYQEIYTKQKNIYGYQEQVLMNVRLKFVNPLSKQN